MPPWTPDEKKVDNNEHLGRRLYDEPLLAGATDQNPFKGLSYRHFEEKRDDKCSLDRLGKSGIDRNVVRYLIPRADADGRKSHDPKTFSGWAWVRAQKLTGYNPKLTVEASPIHGAEPKDNIYHAHVLRHADFDSKTMAFHVRQIFLDHGKVETAPQMQSVVPRWVPAWLRRPIISLLNRL